MENPEKPECADGVADISVDDADEKKAALRQLKKRNKRLRRTTYVLLSVLFALLVVNIIPGGREFFVNALYSCLPTSPKTLELSGTPREMGRTHGEERAWAIKLLCDIYIESVICNGDASVLKSRQAAAEALFAKIAPRWNEEISGIAEGSGVSAADLKLGNSFLDLGYNHLGCREVVAFSQNAVGGPRLLHAHNLDWDNLGGIGNFIVTIFRTTGSDGRFSTVRIGFPGMVGALTIINEKGVSLGFNQLGQSSGDVEGAPVFIAMRDIAETCSCFDEAEKRILSLPKGMPFCITLADATQLRAAVYERTDDETIKRRMAVDGIVAADNYHWCGLDMKNCAVDSTARSARIFRDGTAESEPGGDDPPLKRLKSVIRNPDVLLGCNIYSVIFDFRRNSMYLAAGKIPAAKGKYVRYNLFGEGHNSGRNP